VLFGGRPPRPNPSIPVTLCYETHIKHKKKKKEEAKENTQISVTRAEHGIGRPVESFRNLIHTYVGPVYFLLKKV